jgi:hypothetical protein
VKAKILEASGIIPYYSIAMQHCGGVKVESCHVVGRQGYNSRLRDKWFAVQYVTVLCQRIMNLYSSTTTRKSYPGYTSSAQGVVQTKHKLT